MKKLLKKFPEFSKQLTEFHSLYIQLKKRRQIIVLSHPTGNKKRDLYHHFGHYTNIIHLKLIHQLHLILNGLNTGNPEVITMVRSCIETIGALAYMTHKISKKKQEYEYIWNMLYIATMGQNTKTMSKKATFSKAPQIFHSADYVREVNQILNNELLGIGSKNIDYILESYDFFSEFTHPNYLALQVYWAAETGEMIYSKNISCIKKSELLQILGTLIPLILVYEVVLRKAEKIEQELKLSAK